MRPLSCFVAFVLVAAGVVSGAGAGSAWGAGGSAAASAAAGSVAVVGATAGAGAAIYHAWFNFELQDWKDARTGTTAQLGNQCGMDFEARLLGNWRTNLVYLALHNNSATPVVIKPNRISMTFSSGRERMPEFVLPAGDIEVKPGWRVISGVPFPTKWDFKDQNSVEIDVPVYKDTGSDPYCTISTVIHRDPAIPALDSTYVERSVLDYDFEFGSSVLRTGGMKSLGSSQQFSFGLNIYIYPWVHSGFFFGITAEGYGDASSPIANVASSGANTADLQGLLVDVGYSHRSFLSRKWQMVYDAGFGGYDYSSGTTGSGRSDFGSPFALTEKLSFDYLLGTVKVPPALVFDNSLGISIYQIWVPSGSVGPFSASGNSFGLALRYKLGI